MPRPASSHHDLTVAFQTYILRLQDTVAAVLGARDRVEDAAKVAVLGSQLAAASRAFYETLSVTHAETFGLDPDKEVQGVGMKVRPDAPSNNPDDFTAWARKLARERTHGPISSLHAAE